MNDQQSYVEQLRAEALENNLSQQRIGPIIGIVLVVVFLVAVLIILIIFDAKKITVLEQEEKVQDVECSETKEQTKRYFSFNDELLSKCSIEELELALRYKNNPSSDNYFNAKEYVSKENKIYRWEETSEKTIVEHLNVKYKTKSSRNYNCNMTPQENIQLAIKHCYIYMQNNIENGRNGLEFTLHNSFFSNKEIVDSISSKVLEQLITLPGVKNVFCNGSLWSVEEILVTQKTPSLNNRYVLQIVWF